MAAPAASRRARLLRLAAGPLAGVSVVLAYILVPRAEPLDDGALWTDERLAGVERPVAEFAADRTTLREAVAHLRQRTGADIRFEFEPGLEEDPAAARVSARLRDVPLGRALDLLLENASSNYKLAWRARDGAIVITTADAAERPPVTRAYDVSDLLEFMRRTGDGTDPLTRTVRAAPVTDADRGEVLVQLIETIVDPTSWADSGGSTGAVVCWGGRLIVTQTPRNHRAVAEALDQLRAYYGFDVCAFCLEVQR